MLTPATIQRMLPHFHPSPGWQGLGDLVAVVTKLLGIDPCESCRQRQEQLNRAIPFSLTPPAR